MGSSLIVRDYDPSWVHLFEQLRGFVLPVLSDFSESAIIIANKHSDSGE